MCQLGRGDCRARQWCTQIPALAHAAVDQKLARHELESAFIGFIVIIKTAPDQHGACLLLALLQERSH